MSISKHTPMLFSPAWFKDRLTLRRIREDIIADKAPFYQEAAKRFGGNEHVANWMTQRELHQVRIGSIVIGNNDQTLIISELLERRGMYTGFCPSACQAINTTLRKSPRSLMSIEGATLLSQKNDIADLTINAFEAALDSGKTADALTLFNGATALNTQPAFANVPATMLGLLAFPRDNAIRIQDPLPLRRFGLTLSEHLARSSSTNDSDAGTNHTVTSGLVEGLTNFLTCPDSNKKLLPQRLKTLAAIPAFEPFLKKGVEKTFETLTATQPDHLAQSLKAFESMPEYGRAIQRGMNEVVNDITYLGKDELLKLIEIEQACQKVPAFAHLPGQFPSAGKTLIALDDQNAGNNFVMTAQSRDGIMIYNPDYSGLPTSVKPIEQVTRLLESNIPDNITQRLPQVFEAVAAMTTKPAAQAPARQTMDDLTRDYLCYANMVPPEARTRIDAAIDQASTNKPPAAIKALTTSLRGVAALKAS